MRTLLLVLVMLALALAAGLGLALPAGAQDGPAATLDVACDGGGASVAVTSGAYQLVTCTATARNTGTVALAGVQLAFAPASVALAPPDAYIFWSAAIDGAPSDVGQAQLTYDLGGFAPGTQRTLAVGVILRSTHDFGADLLLLAQPDQHPYARRTVLGSTVAAGPATVPAALTREAAAAGMATRVTYDLTVPNHGAVADDEVSVELAPGTNVRLVDPSGWSDATVSGHLLADLGPLAAGATARRRFTLESATGGCATAQPVVVVTTRQAGVLRRQPLVDPGVLLNACGGGDGGGVTLPSAGVGPSRATTSARTPIPVALLAAVGALALAMAAATRRRGPGAPRRGRDGRAESRAQSAGVSGQDRPRTQTDS